MKLAHVILLKPSSAPPLAAVRRWLVLAIVGCIAIFVTYVALNAIHESWANDGFPEALAVKVDLLPIIFPLHMIAGGLALFLVPAALALRHTRWHRFMGRIAAADVLIAGLTAFPVAWAVPVTFVSAAGFSAQALTWMSLLVAGIWNIRHGRVAAHYTCMLLMAAVTSGAVFFRIYLALWALYGSHAWFKTFYACDSWIAWMLPLMAMAIGLKIFGQPLAVRPAVRV